jgi:hypothetical protein
MNARPLLERVALALENARLEAILFGNAAAALHGAPITTIDFDFLFRRTPLNLRKLKQFAAQLGATVFRPYYPVSSLFRVVNDDIGLQVDFLSVAHGVRSFESLRTRATRVPFGDATLLVASLQDIIKSKRAAGRERDRAVLPVLERTLNASKKTS